MHVQERPKSGGDQVKLSLEEGMDTSVPGELDLIALDDALRCWREPIPSKAISWSCAISPGQEIQETAEVLNISPATVKRHWVLAKAFLKREMSRRGNR
jgi:hypothetical protein